MSLVAEGDLESEAVAARVRGLGLLFRVVDLGPILAAGSVW